MAGNLENINKVRESNGLAPLVKLPGEKATGGDDPPNPPAPEPIKPEPPNPAPEPIVADLDDKQILEALRKKGFTVEHLDDLKPKADPGQTAEKREAEKLSYSLSKGLFSTKEHERFIREKDNPTDLVFAEYHREAKAEDPELSDDEIKAEFEEKYGINADPGTRRFKRGAQEIGMIADKVLRERYKNIYNADETFTQHEQSQQAQDARAQKLTAQAPIYKKHVDEALISLKKIPFKISDDEAYDIDVPDEFLASIKSLFLEPDAAAGQILKGYTPEGLREVAHTALISQHFKGLALEVAKQYHLKRQAGAKGILPNGPLRKTAARALTEDQRKVLADNGINEDDLPAASEN